MFGTWPNKPGEAPKSSLGVVKGILVGKDGKVISGQFDKVIRPLPPPPPPIPEPEPEVLGVRWMAPISDGSGYAEASRNYIAALATAGVDVSATAINFENVNTDYGRAGRFAEAALERRVNYPIQVMFLPPEHYPTYRDPSAYSIGLFDWEMGWIPREWVDICNTLQEIWVPCHWTAEVAKKSGITRSIHVFGHCASPEDYSDGPALEFPEIPKGWFKFYSIFQWTERKNPEGLLRAYLTAFTDRDPVVLILKTYGENYSDDETRAVMGRIEEVKRKVGGAHQPKVLAILGMLTKDEMLGLHRMGDCFVLIHRAEGWGLPHFDACMMGKPVITTNYSANLEFTTTENSYLVGYKPVLVSGMDWFPWYAKDMTWADPDVGECTGAMRRVFKHRKQASARARMAQAYVHKKFSWSAIGAQMKLRIEQIAESL